jgi:hypothetical protein
MNWEDFGLFQIQKSKFLSNLATGLHECEKVGPGQLRGGVGTLLVSDYHLQPEMDDGFGLVLGFGDRERVYSVAELCGSNKLCVDDDFITLTRWKVREAEWLLVCWLRHGSR